MQEMLFCGTGSFKDVDKDARAGGGKEPEAVRSGRRKKQSGGGSKKENPYASRGLDKFSTVVSELESRREKILSRVAPAADGGDHVLVRFVQSEAKGWVPIVVKLPPEEQKQKGGAKKRKQAASSASSPQSTPPTSEPTSPRKDVKLAAAAATAAVPVPVPAKNKKAAAGERWSWGKNVRPRHYMPFVAVLLLVCLVVFGRVFAICCTSVWWYLVPVLSGGDGGEAHGVRRATAKAGKVLAKKASDKKLVTPLAPSHGKRGSSGVHELISPRSHLHGKKV